MDKLDHDLFAVTGSPVLHSKSPELFRAGFRALGMDGQYLRLSSATASGALETAKQMGIRGMNVTSPHKEQMARAVECSDEASRALEAVNTIVHEEGTWKGFNTDPQGVVGAVTAHGFELSGARAMVLGAGGAGRAAAFGLVESGAHVTLVNRSAAKARKWAEKLGCEQLDLQDLRANLQNTDLLVSCLPGGVKVLAPDWLNPRTLVLEADYSEGWLGRCASDLGCETIGGRMWLLHQAVAGFRILLGQDVALTDMRSGLDEESSGSLDNVLLIGFMGAGKSTVGRPLAQLLDMEFVDTDELIEKHSGCRITEIFRTRGEASFRKMEQDVLARVLKHKGQVVACGGGVILPGANRELLRRSGVVVWLWAPLAVCMKRADNGDRPLLSGRGPEGLYHRRVPMYAACSHMVVSSSEPDVNAIARMVANEVRGIWKNRR